MSRCAECREILAGYVLGAIEDPEAEDLERHLRDCPACAGELARLEGLPALLDLVESAEAPPERPPATLEEDVLDRYALDRRRARELERRSRRWRRRALAPATGALAGAVATVALLAAAGVFSKGDSAQEVRLSGSPAAPGASAAAMLKPARNGTRVQLEAEGLPPTPGAACYEVWFVRPQGRVSAGTFRVGADGAAEAALTSAALPAGYERIGVSREPHALDPAKNGPDVLVGELVP